MLYLDNAATSFKKPLCVYQAIIKHSLATSVNAGHGGHDLSLKGMGKIIEASEAVADLFHIADPQRIAFLPNATYGLNMAIAGLAGAEDHIIVTQMDHNSVLRPAHQNTQYTVVAADAEGFVRPQDIEKAVRSNTKLIVCTHVSNVCGSIQPIREISKIAKKHHIPFLLDAAQSAGCLHIDVKQLGVDLLAFSGHKGLMGPLGTGGLYVGENIRLRPLISGGTGSMSESLSQPSYMPDMLHSGTMNTPGIIALGEGARFIKQHDPQTIGAQERYLAESLISEIKNMNEVKVYGKDYGDLRNGTVAFNIGKQESGRVAELLNDDHRIAVRGGWHCAPLAHKALGTEETGAVRASFGFFNTLRDKDRLVDAIYQISKG